MSHKKFIITKVVFVSLQTANGSQRLFIIHLIETMANIYLDRYQSLKNKKKQLTNFLSITIENKTKQNKKKTKRKKKTKLNKTKTNKTLIITTITRTNSITITSQHY